MEIKSLQLFSEFEHLLADHLAVKITSLSFLQRSFPRLLSLRCTGQFCQQLSKCTGEGTLKVMTRLIKLRLKFLPFGC